MVGSAAIRRISRDSKDQDLKAIIYFHELRINHISVIFVCINWGLSCFTVLKYFLEHSSSMVLNLTN